MLARVSILAEKKVYERFCRLLFLFSVGLRGNDVSNWMPFNYVGNVLLYFVTGISEVAKLAVWRML